MVIKKVEASIHYATRPVASHLVALVRAVHRVAQEGSNAAATA